MGMNYYLHIYRPYNDSTIKNLPLPEYPEERVQELVNGYVWNCKYYPSLDELNKEFYFKLHIGKNSSGWVFGLRGLPKYNIGTLDDWIKLFNAADTRIFDEEDRELSASEMIDIITNKKAHNWDQFSSQEEYEKSIVDQYNKNYYQELEEEKRCPRFINLYTRPVADYDDYLSLRDFGERGALRGPNGLLRRQSLPYHQIQSVPGATYDIIIEDGNYGW